MNAQILLCALFLASNFALVCEQADFRARTVECLEKSSAVFGHETTVTKEHLAKLYQHNVAAVKKTPEYVTISDGTLVLDAESTLKSGLLAFKTTEPTKKRPFLSRAEIKKTSIVPSFTGSGLQLKKKEFARDSIYFQSGKQQPKYIRASGKTKVFMVGNPNLKTMEIWVSGDAECYIENVSLRQLIIHARNNGKVHVASGTVEKMYISSREYTSVKVGGVSAKEIIINGTNGPVGTLTICATDHLFKLGKSLRGNIDTTNGISLDNAIKKSSVVYKTKRLVTRSIPGFFKKTTRCAFLTAKYTIVTVVTLGVVASSAIGIGFCIFADMMLDKINELIAPSGEKITYGTFFDLATGKTSVDELGDDIKDGLIEGYVDQYIRENFLPAGAGGSTPGGSSGTGSSEIVIDGRTYTVPPGFDWTSADPALFDAFMSSK